mgnify:CR=1 FL=1
MIIKVDGNNPDNFTARRLIEPGRYLFEIAEEPKVTMSKNGNPVVNVQLRVADDGANKGAVVFDNLAVTPKSEFRLCHLVMAAGSQTKDEIAQSGVDLSLLTGRIVEADVIIEPPQKDPATGQMYSEKNRINKYIFNAE